MGLFVNILTNNYFVTVTVLLETVVGIIIPAAIPIRTSVGPVVVSILKLVASPIIEFVSTLFIGTKPNNIYYWLACSCNPVRGPVPTI